MKQSPWFLEFLDHGSTLSPQLLLPTLAKSALKYFRDIEFAIDRGTAPDHLSPIFILSAKAAGKTGALMKAGDVRVFTQ